MDDFNKLVNETDAQIEATTKRSKFASKRSLFIKSTQELLAILGYKLGKADGISGPLTAAAIEANLACASSDLLVITTGTFHQKTTPAANSLTLIHI